MDMAPRPVPGTDLSISPLVLGTMTFGARVDRHAAARMVGRCREAGITMFDTANSYNDGESERILGEVVAPFRSEVLIASKVFKPMGPGADDRGLRRPAIEKALDATLKRLGTDYLDVYYLHFPDPETPVEESLETMQDAVAAGKVRHVGLSNHAAWQVADIRCLQGRRGWPAAHVCQPMYNLLARRLEDEYAAFSARYDIFNVVYNPLAGGLLTGKHADPQRPQAGTRFAEDLGETYRERYWNAAQFEAVGALRQVASEAGLTLVELAFRWLLSRPVVGSVLLGASDDDQLAANITAAQGPAVPTDVEDACDEVWARLRGAAPRYNR
jgi:aryl-alcohol dehydrogenase-like predicted oxidoreductase